MLKKLPYSLNSNGFTLIEILIAVAIVTTISAFGIASFNNASRANTLPQQADEIKSTIRRVRTDAVSGAKSIGNCVANGQFYGSFVTFDKNEKKYFYGISCFDKTTGADYSRVTSADVRNNLSMLYYGCFSSCTSNLIAFYTFEGEVLFYDVSDTVNHPSKNDLDTNANLISPPLDPMRILLQHNPTSLGSTLIIYLSSTGLVCYQDSLTNYPTCAEP